MTQKNEIAQAILATANERGITKSTCPSEIARLLYPDNWRKHMEEVRNVAIALSKQGKVIITQKGMAIDTENIKGPIRIKINVAD